jgi:diketogulonate reductase-like aldo/keto reductase
MENLVKKGLVKSIGVANFSGMMLADIATYANIMPAINQIELHPYLAQSDLVQYCQNNNIAVTAYSPLGRQGVKDIAPPRLFDEQIVLSLAKKYDKTPAQILLNWGICRGTIVIPKSVTPSRILENINVFDFELDKKEVEAITELDCNRRFVDPSNWWNVPCFN